MIPEYPFKEIEKKWQDRWESSNLYKTDFNRIDNKLYCLVMFLYPSGDRLHIGHWYNYGPTDTWARFKRMQGYHVFEPMGYDAFGLPAENYAIKHGIHPAESTDQNINNIREQLKVMGAMYDWTCEIDTSKPEYYKWTQWLFLQLYKNNLAYRKKAAVNWCPSCQTVLANEQVIEGLCERCESEVYQKDLEQWFFKTTDYAERLLEGLEKINWPEKTIAMQKNWIGKSTGATIDFKVEGGEDIISVFTTRPDTVYGVTYMVLAPEHPLVEQLTTPEHQNEIQEYIKKTRREREIDRLSTEREKTGVFTGSYCVNPLNQERVPVWIADYVLVTYGTGAVMAVPAHDERDFEFAQKYRLNIRKVIQKPDTSIDEPLTEAYINEGIMVNSGPFNGLNSKNGIEKIIEWLETANLGKRTINYKLRDWLISRQRYWGAPIPIVYCKECGQVAVAEKDLPVKLPKEVDFSASGKSPIATNEKFVNTTCPKCGGPATREVDTMDTFVCSSWYYLRFPNSDLNDKPFDKNKINNWLPVDQYVGGAEHAVMHLLYARFITKVLHDIGYIDFDEPFVNLIHQGTITNAGAKMSKSKGNVVNPDTFIEQYGSDTFRMYTMFMGSYEDGGDWSDDGIKGIDRFINRVWRLVQLVKESEPQGDEGEKFKKVNRQMHYAIKHATESLNRFHFNTAISRIMELVNETYLYVQDIAPKEQNRELLTEIIPTIVRLIAPFSPHMGEELWEILGHKESVFGGLVKASDTGSWPEFDEERLKLETVTYGIQINKKIRGEITVQVDASKEEIIAEALKQERVQKYVKGKRIVKQMVIPGKLVVFALQ